MSRKKLPSKIATGNLPQKEESIYDLIGLHKSPYKQSTKAEYTEYLSTLPTTDLQRHAIENGVIPNAVSRQTIINRLENLYAKRKISTTDQKVENKVAVLDEKSEAEIAAFLNSAR